MRLLIITKINEQKALKIEYELLEQSFNKGCALYSS